MKNYFKLFAFFVRSSLYRVLLALAVIMAVEWVVFYRELQGVLPEADQTLASLWWIMDGSSIEYISVFGFIELLNILLNTGRDVDGKSDYTFYRLGVASKAVFWCQAAGNILMLLLSLLVQMYTVLTMCFYYVKVMGEDWVTSQTVFLQMYRSEVLFSLIPLESTGIWVRNLMLCVTLGITAAHFTYSQRRRKFSVSVLLLALATAWLFYKPIGSYSEVVLWPLHVIVTGITVAQVYYGSDKKE